MSDNKKPGEPVEEERRAQEIQITQLNEQFSCEINGMPIQNVRSYWLSQSSNGNAVLNLTLEISPEAVSTMIQAQTQPRS